MFSWLKDQKEKNRLRFFTYSVYAVFLIFIVILLGLIFLNIIENKGNVRESYIFNKRPTIVITGSMEPVIQVNSVVILEPVEFEDIEVGDIIRYTSYNGYSIMHRVIKKNISYVVTKGDANEKADEFVVTPDRITGRVQEIYNEFAEPLTFIFGKFEYDNMIGSVLRACLGFIGIGITISVLVVMYVLIFEMITTTYFFKKYNKDLVESSSYWVNIVPNVEGLNKVIEKYNHDFKDANILKKILLSYKLRKFYNGLCNIEKETLKTEKRKNNLLKFLK